MATPILNRTLMLSALFPPEVGGIQNYALALAQGLAARSAEFALITAKQKNSQPIDRGLDFPVHRIRDYGDELAWSGIPAFAKHARKRRPEVAFCTHWATTFTALRARQLTSWPRVVVCGVHGREVLHKPLQTFAPAQFVYDAMRRFAFARADLLVPVSRFTGTLLEAVGVEKERIAVLPNGVDPHRYQPVDASSLRQELELEGRLVILTMTRLVKRKGIDMMLRAMPQILKAHPDAVYLIAGDGPDRKRLEDLAAQLGLGNALRFVPRVTDEEVNAYYSLCDVFAMTSRSEVPDVEGFGLVFLEAGACERPVVGGNAGGVPDAIDEGETGFLVDPHQPEHIARKICELLASRELRQRFGKTSRQRILQSRTWAQTADVLATHCQRLQARAS